MKYKISYTLLAWHLKFEIHFLSDGFILGRDIFTVKRARYIIQLNFRRTQFSKKVDFSHSYITLHCSDVKLNLLPREKVEEKYSKAIMWKNYQTFSQLSGHPSSQ